MEYTFLIVDDEQLIRNGISTMIASFNESYKIVAQAEDVQEAVELYLRHMPDIVITDICMYELSGVDLIEQLKRINQNVNIVVISGYDDFDYVKKSLKFGACDYLLKPINVVELKTVIDNICEKIIRTDIVLHDTKKRKIIEIAKKYVNENFMKNLTLRQVADQIGISSSYLSELFSDYNNDNFVEYITNVRIEKAKEILKDPIVKVYEVGYMVGYEDPAYFSRVFKKSTGVSPAKFQSGN